MTPDPEQGLAGFPQQAAPGGVAGSPEQAQAAVPVDALGEGQSPPTEGAPRDGKHKHAKKGSFLGELPFLVLIGVVIVVVFRAFLVQAFYIPSGSMEVTLLCNDRVLVNRQAYTFGPPDRGDVIVFRNWNDVGQDVPTPSFWKYLTDSLKEGLPFWGDDGKSDDLIKRVVGVPGDTLQVKGSRVYINGKKLDEPYVFIDGPDGNANFGPVEVPSGHVFVMGDHRNDSQDSRAGSRFVDFDAIVGKAFVRIWPVSRMGGLRGPPSGVESSPNCP